EQRYGPLTRGRSVFVVGSGECPQRDGSSEARGSQLRGAFQRGIDIERDIAVRVFASGGAHGAEVEELTIQEMRRYDIVERVGDRLDASGVTLFPFAQHCRHLLSLQVLL